MMALTPGGHVRIESQSLECQNRRLAVLATVQSRRDGLGGTRVVPGKLNTRLPQDRKRRLAHRLSLLFVVAGIRHVTRNNDLTCLVHTRLRIAAVIPALVVGRHLIFPFDVFVQY